MKKSPLFNLFTRASALVLLFVVSYFANLLGKNYSPDHKGKALDIEKVYAEVPVDAGGSGGGGDGGSCGDGGDGGCGGCC